jgi:hypothetical protein
VPIVGGPVGTLLVAIAAASALAVWLVRRPKHRGPRLVGDDGIDHERLAAAEREVRELEHDYPPEEGYEGDDWGPGAARPRPPVRL